MQGSRDRFGVLGPAMPRPVAAKTVTDRAALLAGIAARRRHAVICARRAVEGPIPAAASRALAS
jgi:hypothetical protein